MTSEPLYVNGKFCGIADSIEHEMHRAICAYMEAEDDGERDAASEDFEELKLRAGGQHALERLAAERARAFPTLRSLTEQTADASDKAAAPGPVLLWASSIVIPEVWNDPYLIKGLLQARADAQLFGKTNQGKTFIALNIGAHIASGAAWMGQKTARSGVLVLAYEGLEAMPRRLAALKRQFPANDWESLPLAVVAMRSPLVDERTMDQNTLPGRKDLQAVISAFVEHAGDPPGLIVVDTYSKAIGGSTSSEELAAKFASMAQALIARYGSTVLRVHHPGHTNQERSKGASSIGQGVDSDIMVDEGVIKTPKQRDTGKRQFGFQLDTVALGRDQDGDQITSCIVVPRTMGADGLGEHLAAVMALIAAAANGQGQVARKVVSEAAKGVSISAAALRSALRHLRDKGRISYTTESVQVLERDIAAMFDDDE